LKPAISLQFMEWLVDCEYMVKADVNYISWIIRSEFRLSKTLILKSLMLWFCMYFTFVDFASAYSISKEPNTHW